MLTDQEVIELKADPTYEKITRVGLEKLVDDILESGEDNLKPSVSSVVKLISKLWRARTIRAELDRCTRGFLERFVNRELRWPRTPQSVQTICDAHEAGYKWMRYDEPRVRALLTRSQNLLTDAQFRSLLKKHSSLLEELENQRLTDLRVEMEALRDRVILSIRTHGIFDDWANLNKDVFYRMHEEQIQRRILEGGQGGPLGLPGAHE